MFNIKNRSFIKIFTMTNSQNMNNETNISFLVGQTVKALRTQQNLSLSTLAQKANISKGTLSVLEEGKGNPTISTLWSLAQALNVPFGKLIAPLNSNIGSIPVKENGISVRLIEQSSLEPVIECYHLELEPHGCREADPHPPGVREQLTVIKGYLLTGPVDAPKKVSAGETYSFAADCDHIYVTLSQPASAILFIIYPQGKKNV